MSEADYYSDKNSKIFYAFFEDYFITVETFSFHISISETVGENASRIKLSRLIEEGIPISKQEFENAHERIIERLLPHNRKIVTKNSVCLE